MKRLGIVIAMSCLMHVAIANEPMSSGTEPQFRIEETVDYYDVTARDRVELLGKMRVPGADDKFPHAHGLTRASFTIERKLTQKQDRCSIDTLGIHLGLHITLPRWALGVGMPQGLQKDWNNMRDLVTAHENRHRQNALDAAFAMRRGFAAIEPSARCDKVEAVLKRELDMALLKQQLADQFLDQRAKPAALQVVDDPTATRVTAQSWRGR